MRKEIYGERHTLYASILFNLGNLYATWDKYEASEQHYLQALDIYQKNLGEKHAYCGKTHFYLGLLYYKMAQYKKAEPSYLRALTIYQQTLGEPACETARGQIDPHEGVLGLQRAFKIAGADYMLLSLWQVPDKETVELMQAFYKHYLKGETPSIALHKAQAEMRRKYPNPYYWAAFVLIE